MALSLQSTQEILTNVNWSQPTWDLFIVAFYIIAVVLYGISMGKSRLTINMVAIYISMAIARSFPDIRNFMPDITAQHMFTFQTVLFLGIFVTLFYLLSRKSALSRVVASYRREKWLHTIVFSVVHVGLILSTILSFVPSDQVIPLSDITRSIFVSDLGLFAWTIAPIAAMIAFPDKRRRARFG